MLLSAGLIFNVVLFVLPGLIVYGIGAAISKKKKEPEEMSRSAPTVAASSKSIEQRLPPPSIIIEGRKVGDQGGWPYLDEAECTKELIRLGAIISKTGSSSWQVRLPGESETTTIRSLYDLQRSIAHLRGIETLCNAS